MRKRISYGWQSWVSCRVGRRLCWGDCSVQNASVLDMWLRDKAQAGQGLGKLTFNIEFRCIHGFKLFVCHPGWLRYLKSCGGGRPLVGLGCLVLLIVLPL